MTIIYGMPTMGKTTYLNSNPYPYLVDADDLMGYDGPFKSIHEEAIVSPQRRPAGRKYASLHGIKNAMSKLVTNGIPLSVLCLSNTQPGPCARGGGPVLAFCHPSNGAQHAIRLHARNPDVWPDVESLSRITSGWVDSNVARYRQDRAYWRYLTGQISRNEFCLISLDSRVSYDLDVQPSRHAHQYVLGSPWDPAMFYPESIPLEVGEFLGITPAVLNAIAAWSAARSSPGGRQFSASEYELYAELYPALRTAGSDACRSDGALGTPDLLVSPYRGHEGRYDTWAGRLSDIASRPVSIPMVTQGAFGRVDMPTLIRLLTPWASCMISIGLFDSYTKRILDILGRTR